MRLPSCSRPLVILVLLFGLGQVPLACAADNASMKTISPDELVRLLTAKTGKPLLFQVGSHMLYVQAHIPGSEYLGAGSTRREFKTCAGGWAPCRRILPSCSIADAVSGAIVRM